MGDWLARLAAAREAGEASVLVTVIEAAGSTPREAGAKMLVTAEGLAGSIGGGHLEHAATGIARKLLAAAEPGPRVKRFPLGPALGQCCGGSTTVLFEPMPAPRFRVALFGAGHVGRALAEVLSVVPCRIDWFDSRDGQFPAPLPANARAHATDDPAAEVAGLPAGACLLVMTHSHQLDFQICEAALRRADLRLVGLIGSATKRARFERRFAARGMTAEAMGRLVCPIGLPGLGGKHPGEIAVAVAAQLVAIAGGGAEARLETAPLAEIR